MITSKSFVKSLASISFKDTFNPYADRCPVHDSRDAPKSRARMLENLLAAAVKTEIDSIWIGRDLGYRGGRRTGLALTDDVHIREHGRRWGIDIVRPTKGEVVAERTAAVIWDILDQIEDQVFLWNVFPLHPHEPDNPFSNRTHNSKERKTGEEVLAALITLLRPRRLIAIGNDAENTAFKFSDSIEIIKVRHPSYGGQTDFLKKMREIYNLRKIGQISLL